MPILRRQPSSEGTRDVNPSLCWKPRRYCVKASVILFRERPKDRLITSGDNLVRPAMVALPCVINRTTDRAYRPAGGHGSASPADRHTVGFLGVTPNIQGERITSTTPWWVTSGVLSSSDAPSTTPPKSKDRNELMAASGPKPSRTHENAESLPRLSTKKRREDSGRQDIIRSIRLSRDSVHPVLPRGPTLRCHSSPHTPGMLAETHHDVSQAESFIETGLKSTRTSVVAQSAVLSTVRLRSSVSPSSGSQVGSAQNHALAFEWRVPMHDFTLTS